MLDDGSIGAAPRLLRRTLFWVQPAWQRPHTGAPASAFFSHNLPAKFNMHSGEVNKIRWHDRLELANDFLGTSDRQIELPTSSKA